MFDFDQLFQEYVTLCETNGMEATIDQYISECITLTQDEDDPVYFWVTQYVIERDRLEPGWTKAYAV